MEEISVPAEQLAEEVNPVPEVDDNRSGNEIVDSDSPLQSAQPARSLMSLDEALEKIPESLKSEMKELLRADFREVRRLGK